MGYITINGKKVEFTDEKNVLSIIRKAGIDIPTLCYHSELSTFGACRLCTVEDDRGRLFASCSEEPRDGMVIYTHTERLRKHRKLIVELLLAAHCRDCTTCVKSGECKLQELAHNMGVLKVRYENYNEIRPVDYSSPAIVRDPNKCILCGNCVRVCSELQGIGVLGFANRGTEATVTPAFEKKLSETDCVSCGQCRVFCPTGALTIRTHMDEVWEALGDKNTRVVAQIAPAVRVAVGDAFGMKNGENVMGKIVAALHAMGFDEVFDTTYTADLTIMEEATELLEYLKTRSARDYALVNLILRTGLRTIEVSRADIGDITVKKGRRVLKVWGKGLNEKDNIVILNDPVWIPIRDYLEGRVENSDDQPLFVTDGKGHRGCRMSARLIQHTCKEAMRAIGLEGHEYSPHSLRHTTAVTILRSGGDWKDVQRVLRHSSPTVSQIYTASIEDEVHLEKNPEGLLDTAF